MYMRELGEGQFGKVLLMKAKVYENFNSEAVAREGLFNVPALLSGHSWLPWKHTSGSQDSYY